MRKVFLGIWATIIALSVETSVFAACPAAGCNYVDADGDGICDYAGSFCNYIDSDGDGICDYCGSFHSSGSAFVDADGDGICDYYAVGQCGGFVDADGDGICDYYAAGQCGGFVDADGDGICDRYTDGWCGRYGYGRGRYFIDMNGVCNYETAWMARGRGHGCWGRRCR